MMTFRGYGLYRHKNLIKNIPTLNNSPNKKMKAKQKSYQKHQEKIFLMIPTIFVLKCQV